MIRKYSLSKDGNIFVSPHFQVKEFASVSGSKIYSDDVYIDDGLLNILEDIINHYNCKYCIVNCGYRTPAHDKAVGGSGKGQHTKGTAADVRFKCQDGSWLDTRYLSCYLEDKGVSGIARISEKSIHIDNRQDDKYWGDEKVGSIRSIWYIKPNCYSFYDYYGIERPRPFPLNSAIYAKEDVYLYSNAGFNKDGAWLLPKNSYAYINQYFDKNGMYMELKNESGGFYPSTWTNEFDKFTTEKPIIEEPPKEEPVIEVPIVETPIIEQPIIETPIEKPIIEEPKTEDTTTSENVPILEPNEESSPTIPNNTETSSEQSETKPNEDINMSEDYGEQQEANNPLLWLVDCFFKFINKLIKVIFKNKKD